MPKSITDDLLAHLAGEVTNLANCWQITRTDGVSFYFTDHDIDLIIDGNVYLSRVGYQRTAIATDSIMTVDNLDVTGLFDDASLTEVDLRAGKFDFAEVLIFTVNWLDIAETPLDTPPEEG